MVTSSSVRWSTLQNHSHATTTTTSVSLMTWACAFKFIPSTRTHRQMHCKRCRFLHFRRKILQYTCTLLHRAHALHGLGSIIREFRVTCVDVVTCGTWNSQACGRGVISAVVICYTMLSVTGQLVPLVVNHMYRTARMAQFRTNVPKSAIYVRTDRRSASVHPQPQRRSGKRTFPPNGGVGVVRVSGANYRGSWTVQHCHKLRT